MRTPWIEPRRLERAQEHNRAFWDGTLQEGPLMWVTAPDAKPGRAVPAPASDEELWTNVDYVIAAAESMLARTHYAGDALPVFCPWLGPDQFAAWLGADLVLKPRDNTSWSVPFVRDWEEHARFTIDADNRWWKLYQAILSESVRAGKDRWVTGYPDLHTGIDALRAVRGSRELALDLVTRPEVIARAMRQMTELWKLVVDKVSAIILPAGQGTSNWTMGWSDERFLCIGQNDFSCLIDAAMFRELCENDNRECCAHVDRSIYHLDGPGAVRHLPCILELERLDCVQWIQGAGRPLPSQWCDLLRRIQAGGKSVQVYYGPSHGGDADLAREIDVLVSALDPRKLFVWVVAKSAEEADGLVRHAMRAGRGAK